MSAVSAERLARVVLSRVGEPGDPRLCRLSAELGGERLLHELLHDAGDPVTRGDLGERLAGVDPHRELEQAARLGVRFVIPGDDEWPRQLDDLAGGRPLHDRGGTPVGLWVRGPMRLDRLGDGVAVVGSRSATTYGDAVAVDLAAAVARTGRPVVSGAAAGIDHAAHRGALAAGGATVAVLACSAERAYPAAHRRLIDHIAEHFLVVSEVPPGCHPTRIRFLARNRLIAALSCGTVVVEAAIRSGALNTARWAETIQRPVMGVPGPVTSGPSEGVHELIRDQRAVLVTSAADVLEMVGAVGEDLVAPRRAPVTRRDRLSTRDRQVLDAVPVVRPAPTHAVAHTAGIRLLDASAALGRLAEAGLVCFVDHGWRLAGSHDDEAPAPTMQG